MKTYCLYTHNNQDNLLTCFAIDLAQVLIALQGSNCSQSSKELSSRPLTNELRTIVNNTHPISERSRLSNYKFQIITH